jgi:hypothetical protein
MKEFGTDNELQGRKIYSKFYLLINIRIRFYPPIKPDQTVIGDGYANYKQQEEIVYIDEHMGIIFAS